MTNPKPKPEFTDTERLEWLIKSDKQVFERCGGYVTKGPLFHDRGDVFPTPREAIDDAMRRERNE